MVFNPKDKELILNMKKYNNQAYFGSQTWLWWDIYFEERPPSHFSRRVG